MIELNIKIDPQNVTELTEVLELVQKLLYKSGASERCENSSSQDSANQRSFEENRTADNEVAELKKEIDMHRKENEKNQEIISQKDKEIKDLTEKNEVTNNCYKEDLEKKSGEIDKQKQDHDIEVKEFKNKLDQKDKEIQKLKELLENYSPDFGSDGSNEKKFFAVKDNKLEQNMILVDSLYYAIKKGESYKFKINADGPIKMAISNIEEYIEPFCEIKDRVEGANTINTVSTGTAQLTGIQLQVKEKAVVSLIKQ